MRGQDSVVGVAPLGLGITPAYAGTRDGLDGWNGRGGDHPRVCGDKGLPGGQLLPQLGSPPRMRGQGRPGGSAAVLSGITPAYAGTSCLAVAVRTRQEDHPRVCGDKPTGYVSETIAEGSPPRMRGQAPCPPGGKVEAGITPAYAGTSQACLSARSR